MKTVKDKQILMAADFAGYPLKEAVVAHLKEKGWFEITHIAMDERGLKDMLATMMRKTYTLISWTVR